MGLKCPAQPLITDANLITFTRAHYGAFCNKEHPMPLDLYTSTPAPACPPLPLADTFPPHDPRESTPPTRHCDDALYARTRRECPGSGTPQPESSSCLH